MITISNEQIPAKVYQELRRITGLSPKSDKATEIGLRHTLHSVLLKEQEEYIGMGRIIGDGGCFCQIVDICVHPQWQGRGLGRLIMEDLMKFIQSDLPDSCYISLIADGEAYHLYEKFGFSDTLPKSKGMFFLK